ncbi:MAG TPA: HAD family hydrolase, partial [Casimicrobiaceae bacterium]|nr:HAD family hydrolase [Casimicrobiaceae bacterium]
MSSELRALIFDVDGTLADTEEFHRRAFNAAFSAADLNWWWNRGTYRELLRVAGGRQRMRAFAEREDASTTQRADFEELLTALHAAKTRRYDASLREEPLPLRPGIQRLFDEAAEAHITLA